MRAIPEVTCHAPYVIHGVFDPHIGDAITAETPWVDVSPNRGECFMREGPSIAYTYGRETRARTYHSVPENYGVTYLRKLLNTGPGVQHNVCFLNRYVDERQHLGWHADDSPGMLHEHQIAVVSFGQAREIWVRPNGHSGKIPPEWRYLLTDGSLFIMPPGFQRTHQHRIPKGDRKMLPRISLTFRRYIPEGVA